MAANSSYSNGHGNSNGDSHERAREGTGSHTDRGVPIILAVMVGVILLMAALNQGHNTVSQGQDVPPGSYSSTIQSQDTSEGTEATQAR